MISIERIAPVRTALLAAVLGAWVAPSAPAATPSPPSPQEREYAEAPDSQKGFRILERRRRDAIHPGDPLDVIGVFEGDNRLTSGRGSLDRSEFSPAFVNEEEARDRRIAMLEDRSWSTTAVGRAPAPSGEYGDGPQLQNRTKPQPDSAPTEPETSSARAWLISLGVAGAAVAALVIQGRRMG